MILYQVEARRLLFICKVQDLTCPQSFSHNAYTAAGKGGDAHTLRSPWVVYKTTLLENKQLTGKQVRFLLSNALHVTRIQFQTPAS